MDTSVDLPVDCGVNMSVDMHEVDPIIGNWLLSQDGSPILDQDGNPIEVQE